MNPMRHRALTRTQVVGYGIVAVVTFAFIAWSVLTKPGNVHGKPPSSSAQPAAHRLDGARTRPASEATGDAAVASPASSTPGLDAPTPVPPLPDDEPLPPLDARVVDFHDELAARAARGDAKAACRLGFELNACRQLPNLRRVAARSEREAAAAAPDSPQARQSAQDAGRFADRIAAREQKCEGVPDAWFDAAPALILQSARAGNDRAAAHYVISPPMDGNDFMQDLEAWRTYGREAPMLLDRAARNGNFAAIYAMRAATAGEPIIRGHRDAIARDPYMAVVYGTAVASFVQPWAAREIAAENADLRRELTPAQYDAAIREGQALSQRHFASFDAQRNSEEWLPQNPERDCDRDQ